MLHKRRINSLSLFQILSSYSALCRFCPQYSFTRMHSSRSFLRSITHKDTKQICAGITHFLSLLDSIGGGITFVEALETSAEVCLFVLFLLFSRASKARRDPYQCMWRRISDCEQFQFFFLCFRGRVLMSWNPQGVFDLRKPLEEEATGISCSYFLIFSVFLVSWASSEVSCIVCR